MTETAQSALVSSGSQSVLRLLNPAEISKKARAESRNREVHLPPISTFRWWARRTAAVNGAVLDAVAQEFGPRRLVVDPFAGGGTIGLAAIARGHRVYVQDINPWSVYGLRMMLGLPKGDAIREAASLLAEAAKPMLDAAYQTVLSDGTPAAIIHTYRVATGTCSACGLSSRLFPYAVLTLTARKERNRPEAYLACPAGHVFLGRSDEQCPCSECGLTTEPATTYTPGRTVVCQSCGFSERLQAKALRSGLGWEVVLVQRCSADRKREFGLPTRMELKQSADEGWRSIRDLGPIPEGRETSVLLRHGFSRWNDLFPRRQQSVTQGLLDLAAQLPVEPVVAEVLKLATVGSTEFAGHLSRWDRWYLKSNDATAGHRFNFSTFVPEPNVWGAGEVGRGTVQRRIRSFIRAAEWLHDRTRRNVTVQCLDAGHHPPIIPHDVTVVAGSSEQIALRDHSADLVLTDPPYHDDVQYGELSLFFRSWAGLPLVGLSGEASVNHTIGLNSTASDYRELLTRIFTECGRILKGEGRLIFSYANRDPSAWLSVFFALQESGFRPLAYTIVHSENETDYAKRHVRSCTKDFVMELVKQTSPMPDQWIPRVESSDPETAFLALISEGFFKIGHLHSTWESEFISRLRASRFLTTDRKRPELEHVKAKP